MSPIFCLLLLALCGTQVLAQRSFKRCKASQNFLIRQQVQAQRLQLQLEYRRRWLAQYCSINLPQLPSQGPGGFWPPIGGLPNKIHSILNPFGPQGPVWELPLERYPSPGSVPQKITIVVTYPPGSPCNPNNASLPPGAPVFRPTEPVTWIDPNISPIFNPLEYPPIPADGKIVIVVECPLTAPGPDSNPNPPDLTPYPPDSTPNPTDFNPSPPDSNPSPSNPSISVNIDRWPGLPQLPTPPNIGISYPNYPNYLPGSPPYVQLPEIPRGGSKVSVETKIEITVTDINNTKDKKTVEIIKNYGYPVETHFVVTTDGYKLCLHRMPRPGGVPVLLVHGLMSSSAIWVQMGPRNGLAYKLYHQGFDVWLLNTRGNLYSQAHINATITQADYWRFSFNEIGIYDLPAAIDRILVINKAPKIQYIGHSQGSTAFFVLTSQLPEYNEKILLMQALSPTVFMKHTQSPVLRFLSLFKGKFEVLFNLLGGYQISKHNQMITQFREHICYGPHQGSAICAIFDFVMCGFGWRQFNQTFTPIVLGHASQGASFYQIYHYAQLISSNKFQSFDLGSVLNMKHYSQPKPVVYNLTQVSCKVAIQHSTEDWLSEPRDLPGLTVQLPNIIDKWTIDKVDFNHYDYLLSENVNSLSNLRVIQNCRKYSVKQTITHTVTKTVRETVFGK